MCVALSICFGAPRRLRGCIIVNNMRCWRTRRDDLYRGVIAVRSATAVTYELDDASAAARELSGQIREKLELGARSVGILYAQPETDVGALSAHLREELGFSIIGGTTAGGAILSNDGHHELAVVLHVLTSSNSHFSTAISPSLATDAKRHIVETYHEALSRLKESGQSAKPRLIFCVTSILQSCSSDDCLATLGEAADGAPIFGVIAADDFEFSKQQVFLDGEFSGDRMALLLVSGDIKPVFEVRNLAGSQTLSKRQVTKSHDNVICEIDGKPAYEYIKEFPFIGEESEVLWNYQFFVEMQNESDNDGVLVSRALNTYDKESGEIFCFANVPQGSYISLLYCNGGDVRDTCEKALDALNEKIEAGEIGGYRYSTVLVASCSLRNMFLADQKDAEGALIRERIPSRLTLSGLYGFGEIAPTSIRGGKAVNRFHNATLAICAL